MTASSDEVSIRVVAHGDKNSDAEREVAATTLQQLLQHQDTGAFWKQIAETVSQANF